MAALCIAYVCYNFIFTMSRTEQSLSQHMKLFDAQKERTWPLENHRAEYAHKVIAIAIYRVLTTIELDLESKKALYARLQQLLLDAYTVLRRADSNDYDPTVPEMMAYATNLATLRLRSLERSGTANLLKSHKNLDYSETDLYEIILECMPYIEGYMSMYSRLDVLLRAPTPSVLHAVAVNQAPVAIDSRYSVDAGTELPPELVELYTLLMRSQ